MQHACHYHSMSEWATGPMTIRPRRGWISASSMIATIGLERDLVQTAVADRLQRDRGVLVKTIADVYASCQKGAMGGVLAVAGERLGNAGAARQDHFEEPTTGEEKDKATNRERDGLLRKSLRGGVLCVASGQCLARSQMKMAPCPGTRNKTTLTSFSRLHEAWQLFSDVMVDDEPEVGGTLP